MTDFLDDREVLARIVELASQALALADKNDLFMLGAKLEDSLFTAKELLASKV